MRTPHASSRRIAPRAGTACSMPGVRARGRGWGWGRGWGLGWGMGLGLGLGVGLGVGVGLEGVQHAHLLPRAASDHRGPQEVAARLG